MELKRGFFNTSTFDQENFAGGPLYIILLSGDQWMTLTLRGVKIKWKKRSLRDGCMPFEEPCVAIPF